MLFTQFQGDINAISKQRNLFVVLFLCAMMIITLLSVVIVSKEKQVVIIPAGFNKELLISDRHVSANYLEEMSHFFANNLLDATPENVSYRSKMVLRHVSPKYYQKVQNHLITQQKKYKDYNLSTSFTVQEIQVFPNRLQAVVEGILHSSFGKGGSKTEKVKFNIKYSFNSGVLMLDEFGIMKQEKI